MTDGGARSKVTVHVTEEMIRQGKGKQCTGCPVALALGLRFHDCFVWVTQLQWEIAKRARFHIKGDMPREASEFIRAFDQGATVAPFSFDIEVPSEVMCMTDFVKECV